MICKKFPLPKCSFFGYIFPVTEVSYFFDDLRPGWKVCQLRTECQETDKILRTKNEINVRTKIKIEIARDGPIPIFYDNVL